jgi:hypothetical protein
MTFTQAKSIPPAPCQRPATGGGKNAAFTMVEIALCLGVIAFALVAIIGVLPTGLRVQRDNREDTIINQEGLLWVEAIRSGSRGLDYLTNFVDTITISNALGVTHYYNPALPVRPPSPNVGALTNGQAIIALLTTYKVVPDGQRLITNRVTARVRAISGSAVEKSKSALDMAFAYQLISEVVRLEVYPPEFKNLNVQGLSDAEKVARTNLVRLDLNRLSNFEELRLTLQGPLIPKGTGYDVFGTRRTFRTLISGRMSSESGGNLVQPSSFVQFQ